MYTVLSVVNENKRNPIFRTTTLDNVFAEARLLLLVGKQCSLDIS
ncbi:hypothetical protein AVEN_206423-1, partial [Araneus ventricosus]